MSHPWKAFFAGDFFLAPGLEPPLCSDALLAQLRSSRFACCNFEGAVEGAGKPAVKAGPHLALSAAAPAWLETVGFNVVNLANNHLYDFGAQGVQATLNAFGKAITPGAGLTFAEANRLRVEKAESVRVGWLSFGEAEFGAWIEPHRSQGAFAWVNHPDVETLIREAKAQTDLLIVLVHAGVEHTPVPLPEWRDRFRALARMGADVVMGSHPHVAQGFEIYRGVPLFYSLGNLYFTRKGATGNGMAVSLTFEGKAIKAIETFGIEAGEGQIGLMEPSLWETEWSRLCLLLQEPLYTQTVDAMVQELWKSRYRHHYERASNGITRYSLIELAKHCKNLLLRRGMNLPLLQHNIRIESHYWAVRRALERMLE
ncbi:MAG: CapA family protein [Bacteroidales bacterium]